MKTMVVECPDKLHDSLCGLVDDGWVQNVGQAVTEALRRFIDSHNPNLIESQLRDDVEWGLQGDD